MKRFFRQLLRLSLALVALALVLALAIGISYRAGHWVVLIGISEQPLPNEASLDSHLERCHKRATTQILPLLQSIENEEQAAAALPQLVEQCRALEASYRAALIHRQPEDEDCLLEPWQWRQRITSLACVEQQRRARDAALMQQLAQEYERLARAGFYGRPQIGNMLGLYVLDCSGSLPKGLQVFCWYPSHPLCRHLAKTLAMAESPPSPALLGMAEWVGNTAIAAELRQRIPRFRRLVWEFFPSATQMGELAANTDWRGMDERPIDIFMLDPLCGVLNEVHDNKVYSGQAIPFYYPGIPDACSAAAPNERPCFCSNIRLSAEAPAMPPALSPALEALPVRHLSRWTREDARRHERWVDPKLVLEDAPDGFFVHRENHVFLRLQAPCKSRYLVLWFAEGSPTCTSCMFLP